MGVLLAAGVVVVLSTIIYRTVKPSVPDEAAPAGRDRARALELDIGGEGIKNIALDGNRVAIHTGREIIVIDVKRQKVIGRISIKSGP